MNIAIRFSDSVYNKYLLKNDEILCIIRIFYTSVNLAPQLYPIHSKPMPIFRN